MIVGLLGAVVGSWLLRAANLSVHLGNPVLDRVVVAVLGAVVLMFIIGLLRPRSFRERLTGVWRR